MKVEISPQLRPHRGGPVELGNVYQNRRGSSRFFRVVVGVVKQENRHPWNNVVCIHVDNYGNVVGCSTNPYNYVKDHQDLIGKVAKMPTLKIEWIKEDER